MTVIRSRSPAQKIVWTVSDTLVMTRRSLLHVIRLPQLLGLSIIQPVMFLLLFNYVFGGAIQTGGVKYIDYLLPGIIVIALAFGSSQTSVGLAEDLSRGMIDRFRSLPMARSAVLAGRATADTLRNTLVVLLMTAIGFIIGFRVHTDIQLAVLAPVLAILLALTFTWISAFIGLVVKSAEAAQAASIIWVAPLAFASSILVPVESMPGWLQAFAKVNPLTVTVDTMRALTLGGPIAASLWKSLAWMFGILVVFVPLAVRRYARTI